MSRRAVPYPCAWLPVPDRSWRPDGEPLTPGEAVVLAVFVDRWRRSEHDVLPLATEELATASGLSVRGAEVARSSLLERRLLVRVHEGGGRGRPSTYRLGNWWKGAPEAELETPQPIPATATVTPNLIPAASAWLPEKPALNPEPNPALYPAASEKNVSVSPSSYAEAEAETEISTTASSRAREGDFASLAESVWTKVVGDRGGSFTTHPTRDAKVFRTLAVAVGPTRAALEASARAFWAQRRSPKALPENWLEWVQREQSAGTAAHGVSPAHEFDPSPIPGRSPEA